MIIGHSDMDVESVLDIILETLEESGHKAIGYADDIVVYSTGKYEDTVRKQNDRCNPWDTKVV